VHVAVPRDNWRVARFDALRRVNGLRHNPRQSCSMVWPGYVARDTLSPVGL
jgi:hypothetical protein